MKYRFADYRSIVTCFLLLLFIAPVIGQDLKEWEIVCLANERWWGGRVNEGEMTPYKAGYATNLLDQNEDNQFQPLLISSKGRFIWSEKPFAFEVKSNNIVISKALGTVLIDSSGTSIKSAYLAASKKYFPFTGTTPDELLFSKPQYNTWIELTYHQNQTDILKYAKSIIENRLPPGVLMIDDTWQTGYGKWEFDCRKFNDPKAMMDSLHHMGFKVMLWVVPFVSMDLPEYRELRTQSAFLKSRKTASNDHNDKEPAPIRWWNGVSALLDFTNPAAVKWFKERLDYLSNTYGVDGFKFDAGDPVYYSQNTESYTPISSNEHSELYAKFGLAYRLNEFRACWKMGGQPLAQRLRDKSASWDDLRKLIPHLLAEGILGYPYACPDMIGGGEWTSYLDMKKIDQDIIVRSAQIHALAPMMQFSLAPWRVLDAKHLDAVKKAVNIRMKYTPEIMRLLKIAAVVGEPIVRSMEYNYPNSNYLEVKDQFFLGDHILVAPMVCKDSTSRSVILPEGKWRDDKGKWFTGPKVITTEVPIDRLPIYELRNN